MPTITPFLWFDTAGEEAAEFYVSIFPNSKIARVLRYDETFADRAGQVLTVDFELDGQAYVALNGGPQFTFSEAVSFMIHCADQGEVDYYWDKLVDGGEPSMCGWLKDKFGFSWQVTPDRLPELLSDPDPGRAKRAMAAMMTMAKIDIAAIEAAADAG
jgi:predicted 3-demethylubiquinone-9 3-methyltransferase (glyoxalase superfamily)